MDEYVGGRLTDEKTLGTDGSQITDTTYGYDALGRNNKITDWTGTTTFKFFDDGSVSEVDYPDGRSQTVNATDPKSGTPTNVTLPNGQSQNQTLNSRGQQQTQNGAGVLPARFTYADKTGALTGMNLYQSGTLDGTPETTTWAYDPATGLLNKKTYNDGTSDVYDYNAKFQLTSLTRPGVFINYHYDASGRQTTSDATDNASGLTVTDNVGGYDDQGRAKNVTQTTSNGGGETQSTATNTYTYDKNGNLASETQAGGVTTVYNYYSPTDDSSTAEPGALENVKLVQGGQIISETDYYYSPSSKRLASITVLAYQNGTVAASQDFTYTYKSGTNLVESITAGEVKTTYGYEANTGRLSSITTTSTGTDPISTLYQAEYTYFNNDQRKTEAVTQLQSDGSTASHNWTFAYDTANELTGVTNTVGGASVYGYTYDGAGNQTGTPMGVADGLNQYANFTYNTRGDLLDDGVYHYTWNALDQLVSETPDNPTGGSQKLEFQYDANARRVETDTYNWNTTTGEWDDEADKVLKYVYQGSQLAAELDGNNNPIVTLARGANGTLISITDYSSGTPHIYVVLHEATSNTVGLADPANGAVVASFQYVPFGAFTSDGGPEVNACPEMFAGMIYDGSAALPYYAWHRYYSPVQNRWIERDPISEQGGLNVDDYANDDPLNQTDRSGLAAEPLGPPLPPELAAKQEPVDKLIAAMYPGDPAAQARLKADILKWEQTGKTPPQSAPFQSSNLTWNARPPATAWDKYANFHHEVVNAADRIIVGAANSPAILSNYFLYRVANLGGGDVSLKASHNYWFQEWAPPQYQLDYNADPNADRHVQFMTKVGIAGLSVYGAFSGVGSLEAINATDLATAQRLAAGELGGVRSAGTGSTSVGAADPLEFTFRGDPRDVSTIFSDGIKAKGTSRDLLAHAIDSSNPPSAFISTSTSFDIAQGFNADQVFVIRPVGGIDVNAALGAMSPFPHELEIAIPDLIAPQNIRGVVLPKEGISLINWEFKL